MYQAWIGTPQEQLQRQRQAVRNKFGMDISNPIKEGRKLIHSTTGINPIYVNVCPNRCMAFTAEFQFDLTCRAPGCNAQRYSKDGSEGPPTCQISYIPLIPRFQLQYRNAYRAEELTSYHARFSTTAEPDVYEDVFSGKWYRHYCSELRKFQDKRDLALRISLDTIGFVDNPKAEQQLTPVVIYLLNLPPQVRDKEQNTLTGLNIPGTYKEQFLHTFLDPLMQELKLLDEGVPDVRDGHMNESFTLRAHVLIVTGK